jgi:Mycothiol maleylpyruvate isomerase N-terminal domain
MTVDRSFVELNHAATERLRTLAARLTDDQWRYPVGEHWTVSIVYAHLAFTDGRALWVLDATQREGKVVNPDYGLFINDVSLPFWAAVPPHEAARLAIETAQAVDQRLENYPADLLELLRAEYKRFLFRAYHRTEHLDEAEAALKEG